MQITEPSRQEVPRLRLQAHLLSVTRKLISLLEYQGIVQNNTPISFLTALTTVISSNVLWSTSLVFILYLTSSHNIYHATSDVYNPVYVSLSR